MERRCQALPRRRLERASAHPSVRASRELARAAASRAELTRARTALGHGLASRLPALSVLNVSGLGRLWAESGTSAGTPSRLRRHSVGCHIAPHLFALVLPETLTMMCGSHSVATKDGRDLLRSSSRTTARYRRRRAAGRHDPQPRLRRRVPRPRAFSRREVPGRVTRRAKLPFLLGKLPFCKLCCF